MVTKAKFWCRTILV